MDLAKKIIKIAFWIFVGVVVVMVFSGQPARAADLVTDVVGILWRGTLAVATFLRLLVNQ